MACCHLHLKGAANHILQAQHHGYGRCFWLHLYDESPLLQPASTSPTFVHPAVKDATVVSPTQLHQPQGAPPHWLAVDACACRTLQEQMLLALAQLVCDGRFSYQHLCLQVCFPVQLSKIPCCPAQVTTAGIRPHAVLWHRAPQAQGSGVACSKPLQHRHAAATSTSAALLFFVFFFVCSLGLTVRTLPHLRLSCLLGCTACAGTMLSSIRTVMALQPIEVTVGILTIYTQVGGLCGGDWEGSREGDIQNKIGRIKQ